MEKISFGSSDKNLEKKVYKAGLVDISKLVETQARDVADHKMTESKEDRSANWVTRTAKRIWKHNIAQEWYRNNEKTKAKKDILENENLYAGQAGIQDFEKAKNAIIERFTDEFEDEMLREEEKNSKKTITDDKTKTAIKDLMKQFAGDPSMSEDAFKEQKKRILHDCNPEYGEKGRMYADNPLDIAREIRNSVLHGEKLNELDFDVDLTLGEARESLNTEAKGTAFDKMVEKAQNSKIGKYIFNEPVAVGIVAGLYSAGSFMGMKVLRSKVAKWGTFGLSALAAGGVTAAKESARLERERSQHIRESAKGEKFNEGDMKRRQEMEKSRYETKSATDILKKFEEDLIRVSTGTVKESELDAMLANLSDFEARVKVGETSKADLVTYSNFSQVEKERKDLAHYRARLKVAIRNGITEGRVEFTKGNFDDYLKQLVEVQSTDTLSKDIEEKDKLFKQMKKRSVAKAFFKTVLIGGSLGFVFQEVAAAFQSGNDGIIEGAWKSTFGDKENLATKTTALEGFRRWISDDAPRLPFGQGHNFPIGSTHMQLPDGVNMHQNPDGTFNVFRGDTSIADHLKLETGSNGDLTDASKALLAKNGITTDFAQTGGRVTENVTRSGEDYINKHPELTEKIHRSFMDNDTPMHPDPDHPGRLLGADKNELKLEWGAGGKGVDENGDFVFQVKHMTDDGSYHDGLSVAAHEQMKKGGLDILLSVTRGTQHDVIPVHVNEMGQAVIKHTSTTGKMLFENNNGRAIFEGAFAEVGHATGIASDGGHNMQILATHIGTGSPNSVTDTIIKDTIISNVKLNVPADWDYEAPIFIPGTPRRPLERGEYEKAKTEDDVISIDYLYSGFSDIKREDYEDRMSEALKNNPNATLDEKKEIHAYLEKQDKEHLKDIEKLASEAGPMSKDCKLSVCIPVAGHQEEAVIYKTLENYLNQTVDNKNFEIVLLVNHPDKDSKGNLIVPDGTIPEIKRFMKDHPEIKVTLMQKVIPFEKAKIGYVRKLLNDAVLKRNLERGDAALNHIILSNDADNKGVSTEYIKNFIDKFEKNSNVDSYMGQLDWDPESYIRNPLVHIGTRLFQYVDMQIRHKNIPSSGANFAFRSGMYAAVNGYSSDANLAEDVDLGRAIKAARIGSNNRKAIDFAGARVSRLFTSSRRAEKAIKDGLSPVEQWNRGFSAFDDEVRKVDWASLSEGVDYKDKEKIKILVDQLENVINRTINAMTWTKDEFKLFGRSLGWLGIKFEITGNNNIRITDASKLINGLEKYQKEGLEILKRKTTLGKKKKSSKTIKKKDKDKENSNLEKNKKEEKKTKEVISSDQIKEILKNKLEGQAKIEKLDLIFNNEKLEISSELDAGLAGGKIKINGLIENSGDSINVNKDLKIEARGYVKSRIENNLSKLVPEIKKYFENKYKQEIKSMKIENNQLSLIFKE